MDVVTAVSGSGPAYFFRMAEALTAAGVEQGLPPAAANELAIATLHGAGLMATRGADLAALRESVTSKGGTTAAGPEITSTQNVVFDSNSTMAHRTRLSCSSACTATATCGSVPK